MRRHPTLLILAAALALAGPACGGHTKHQTSAGAPGSSAATTVATASTASTKPPHCVTPPEGIGPDAYGTLQNADDGRTVCLPKGKELTVFLKADNVDGPLWTPITTSDTAVLVPGNTGIMTLVRGVTGGIFSGARVGTARLASQLPACKPSAPITSGPPSASCGAIRSWSATVVVTAK